MKFIFKIKLETFFKLSAPISKSECKDKTSFCKHQMKIISLFLNCFESLFKTIASISKSGCKDIISFCKHQINNEVCF